MNAIQFQNVSKKYSEHSELSLLPTTAAVKEGEFVTIVGTSGSGKSTLMKLVNRMIEPTDGDVFINGQNNRQLDVVELRRQIGYVIQSGGLFPHMTVGENIKIVPTLLKWNREQIEKRMDELFQLIGLEREEYEHRYPQQLSGGQQQRISIARALAANPKTLLMDEPFGALDPITRRSLQMQLKDIQRRTNKTILFVTHDLEEAFLLGERIMIMDNGCLHQFNTPRDIIEKPATQFVETFIHNTFAQPFLQLLRVQSFMTNTRLDDRDVPRVGQYDALLSHLPLLLDETVTNAHVVNEYDECIGSLDWRIVRQKMRNEEAHMYAGVLTES